MSTPLHAKRKKKEAPVLAYLIIQALSMITIAVVIVVLAALAAVTSDADYPPTQDVFVTATVVAVILAIVTGKFSGLGKSSSFEELSSF